MDSRPATGRRRTAAVVTQQYQMVNVLDLECSQSNVPLPLRRSVDIGLHFPQTHALFPVPAVPDDCLQAMVLFAFGADPIRLTMPKALFQKRAQGIFVGPEY